MSGDIRLDLGFLNNLKTRKLLKDLGDHGVVCTLRLWSYAGDRHKKGILSGFTQDDLEEIAGWTGERGAYASYAIRMRWVDAAEDGTLSIHDWKEHQPWIFHSDKRIEAAKIGAEAKWNKYKKQIHNAGRKRSACGSDADSNAPSPTPSPTPLPKNHSFIIPPIIRTETWEAFEEMRKRIRKPLTDHARKLIVGKLKKLGGDPNTILEESTMNGWSGVFPPKDREQSKQPVDCIGRPI